MPNEPQPYVYTSALGTDQGETPPSWFDSHKSLLLKIGLWSILAVLILLVVVFAFKRGRAIRDANQEQLTSLATNAAASDCAKAKDQAACKALAQTKLAEQLADTSYCHGLSGSDFDSCVVVAALAAKDLTACQVVIDSAKQEVCRQVVSLAKAKEADSFEACASIDDPELAAGCQVAWISARVLRGECVAPPMSEEECATANVLKPAIEAKDPALCYSIEAEETLELCLEVVEALVPSTVASEPDITTDTDGDGLSDYEEVNTWKTDPSLSDTDGDGYDDATEVKGGYNPLGEGRL